jgi:hypothetical protein
MLSTRPSCADQDGTGSPSRFVPSITSAEPCGHKLVRAIAYRQHSSRFGSIDKTKREDPISPAHKRSDPQDPAADTPGAARPPGPTTCGSNTASRSAHQSLLPASAERPATAHGSAARTHPQPIRPASADTPAAHCLSTPPSPRATDQTAISEIDTPSDRRSRRISAQSSTINTCFLPGSTAARVTGKLVNFQLPAVSAGHRKIGTPSLTS